MGSAALAAGASNPSSRSDHRRESLFRLSVATLCLCPGGVRWGWTPKQADHGTDARTLETVHNGIAVRAGKTVHCVASGEQRVNHAAKRADGRSSQHTAKPRSLGRDRIGHHVQ